MNRMDGTAGLRGFVAMTTVVAALSGGATALAGDNPVIMQWFEAKWTDVERRMPDFFIAGYGATWLPPASKASSGSAGYDPWERFDLGSPTSQTAYGTSDYFKSMVDEFHQADGLVYLDAILNHNGAREGSVGFQQAGGWPGFWMAPGAPIVAKTPTSNWGDFHNGNASGYLQSENPSGSNYNLWNGDLVSLVDIAQESNNQFIRHPVAAGNPDNIPAGTSVNLPNANNAAYYPDNALTPKGVVNPGTSRNPGSNSFTFYPFNTVTPLNGDPVKDNTTGLLMRWTQYMLDVYKVDGFRWDAIKHAPTWFWDVYIDAVLYQRRTTPDGRQVTPYSFGECVESQSFTYNNYIRKDAFGNRDCLDINGSGEVRNLVSGGGFGNWQTVLNAHLDNADDGDNNGSIGVNHSYSHDNGTAGDGSSTPPEPTVRQMGYYANAYILMRPGVAKMYHNARGLSRSGGFWPRAGLNTALGVDPVSNAADPTLTRLVQLHNWYARGGWNVLNFTDTTTQNLNDVIVFERRTNLGGSNWSGNVLVGCNDSYNSGYEERNVLTSFPAGTRLIEMTGNAADPVVDPTNAIADVLVVDANQRVSIRVPRNKTNTTEHNKGFVVYGPAIPSGTLTLTPTASSLAADSSGVNRARRRMASIPVITANTFTIGLTTTNGDSGAGNNNNADDNALFRIDQGYKDYNGNGVTDIGVNDSTVAGGYEQFVTQRQPLAGTSNSNGLYQQVIDTSKLSEGMHYLSVMAFRKRNAGEAPLFREWRQAFYVDRTGPAAALTNVPPDPLAQNTTAYTFKGKALDKTATRMHLIVNLATGADPVAASTVFNQMTRSDRYDWSFIGNLVNGVNRVTLVAFEETGRSAVYDYSVRVGACEADFNNDGFVDFTDFDDFVNAFEAGGASADFNNDGFIDFTDFDSFVASFEAGC